jgi:hypothetical protein
VSPALKTLNLLHQTVAVFRCASVLGGSGGGRQGCNGVHQQPLQGSR